jgi:hypothetical protein
MAFDTLGWACGRDRRVKKGSQEKLGRDVKHEGVPID